MSLAGPLRQLASDETGATAIEYGLIASLVVIACIVSLKGVANESTGLWGTVSSNVEREMTEANGP